MSEDNVELVRRGFEAANRRDVEALIEVLDPEVEWHSALLMALEGEAAVYRGHEGIREFFRDLDELFEQLHAEYPEIRDLGDRVVGIGRIRMWGKGSGAETESPIGTVIDLKNDKVIRVRTYLEPKAALEAAGLEESAMSQENVEVVRQLVQAFNQRDLAAMTHWFAPEVEWEPGGPAAVERALYRGRDEVSSGFASTWETWEVFQVEENEVRDLGDSVVWLGSAHMRGGDANHLEFDQPFAIDFLVRGGKVARFRGFLSWQEALEAAGLRE